MAQSEILQLGTGDRVLAGMQLAALLAAWLIMYLPMCLLASVSAVRHAVARRS